MINKVTITGADNSITPLGLKKFSEKYPFVEWGILVSKKNFGGIRFPSKEWIEHLIRLKGLELSCHLCGSMVNDILMGNFESLKEIDSLLKRVKRVQINTHAVSHPYNIKKLSSFIKNNPQLEFIFQWDNVNTTMISKLSDYHNNVSTLFDLSHGAGVLPSEWPKPIESIKCGYAGGLSPENLEDQIQKIESITGNTKIWIDMETHVRSSMDLQFDLQKVRKCLDISSKYVKESEDETKNN